MPRAAPCPTIMKNLKLAWYLALNDMQFRYARSFIGPMWVALQMAVFVLTLGFVLSEVHGAPIRTFIPFFAVSLLFWTFLNSSINEGMDSLQAGAGLIKDRGIRPVVPVLQTVLRNLLIAFHCLAVPALVLLWFGGGSLQGLVLAVPGMILFVAVTTLMTFCVAGLGVRYRDIKRIIETLMLLGFLATPILWEPGVLRSSGSYVLTFNPFAHLFAVWRDPLLSGHFPTTSFIVCLGLLVIAGLGAKLTHRWLRNAVFWL
jgi:ABC-type polysaccharide/polyol phosphate export permease